MNPIMNAPIIGQPKTLSEIKPLNADEIKMIIEQAGMLLKSGQPLDIPVALMGMDILRLAVTLKEMSAALAVAKSQDVDVDGSLAAEARPALLDLSRFGSE